MALPRGIYRITQWGSHAQPQVLSILDNQVTVLPPGAAPEKDQEWSIEIDDAGLVAIQFLSNTFLSSSLSYVGEPIAGARIVLGPRTDFPTRKWLVEPSLQKPSPTPYFIRVPNTNVAVTVSPLPIHPSLLVLKEVSSDLQDAWAFEFLREN